MANDPIKICLAQINPRVGALDENRQKLINAIDSAKERQAEVIIFPELAITGYPPEDLLIRPAFLDKARNILENIIEQATDIDIILGHLEKKDNCLYNASSLLRAQKIFATYHKQDLPNYSVFDEKRYFQAGNQACIVDIKGVKCALTICEDLWEPHPTAQASAAGAELIININASPFHNKKVETRRHLLKTRATENNVDIIYLNMVGGQDELVFDGGSMVADKHGEIPFQAPEFEEGLYYLEYHPNNTEAFVSLEEYKPQTLSELEAIYRAIVLGVKDYADKNGFKGAVIGLSGGIDSALTLCIGVDALGAENIEVLMMPSRYTAEMSNEDAIRQATTLGVEHHTIPIERPFAAFLDALKPIFSGLPMDTTEENIQARCRGILLMALSNKTGKLLLTTGNKSEVAVGYATLYGDMAGGFAPLKDAPKTLVYKLAEWINRDSEIIPWRVIKRPPSAELKPDQTDQDALPPYDILDPILERYVELDQSPEQIIAAGFEKEMVLKIIRMIDRNEYKRRQAAPGVRLSQKAFGRDRRYPISSGYVEQ